MAETNMEERRRYFRLYDNFRVQVTPARADKRETDTSAADVHKLKLLIAGISARQPEIGDALALIDRRLANLEGTMDGAEVTVPGINLSACGVAFLSDKPMRAGSMLDLSLYIDHASLVICTLARVVESVPAEGHAHQQEVRVDYVDMNADERELLIQYMLKRQGEQLRQRANG